MSRNPQQAANRTAVIAWVMAAVYYFYQYVSRAAPAVMMPQLSEALGLGAVGVASIVGLFYYGYSSFSLVAGVVMDRLGPRRVVPVGAALMGVGALLFASGTPELASVGRALQGAGGAVAIVGAIYIATQYFPASRAATLIGATQMFGMAGGSVGQFAVGPLIAGGVAWSHFWLGMGVIGFAISAPLYLLLPNPNKSPQAQRGEAAAAESALRGAARALTSVFRNPQTVLCGVIAGLLFIPTTIFDMVWGVRYLQEAVGYDYGAAVMRSSMVPLGWIIGCPLLGWISDQIGRRKPVIAGGAGLLLACLAWILYGPTDVMPPYVMGLLAGLGSGAAMLPTTVAKEANAPELGGTTVGAVTFVNFTFSALLGPVFASLLQRASGGAAALERAHFQTAFQPLLYGVGLAILLLLLIKETGPAARPAAR